MANGKGLSVDNWLKIGLYVAGAYVGWAYVLSPLLEKLGAKESKEDKLIEEALYSNAWNRSMYLKAVPGKAVMTDKAAQGFAWAVLDSLKFSAGTILEDWLHIGFVDFEKLFGVFKTMYTKSMVSQLSAKIYQLTEGQDLYQILKKKLREEQFVQIIKYVNKLPDYIRPKTSGGAGASY